MELPPLPLPAGNIGDREFGKGGPVMQKFMLRKMCSCKVTKDYLQGKAAAVGRTTRRKRGLAFPACCEVCRSQGLQNGQGQARTKSDTKQNQEAALM
jgi:hypothetical protein